MSANYLVRNGAIAAMGISGLLLSACAGNHGSRYAGSVYDYESGGSDCSTTVAAPNPCQTYVDFESGHVPHNGPDVFLTNCGSEPMAVGCAPAPAPTYVPPAPVYTQSCGVADSPTCGGTSYSTGTTYSGSTYSGGSTYTGGSTFSGSTSVSTGSVECPAGTTLQADNTCLQGSGSSYIGSSSTTTTSYSAPTTTSYVAPTTSYSAPTTTSYVAPTTTYSGPVTCPSGTTLQPDNTCMQNSSSYSSGSSYSTGGSSHSTGGSSYTSSTVTSSSTYIPESCPSGTVMQGDGSCASVGYGISSGYTATDYLPIRK